MKNSLSVLIIFSFFQSICFSQNLQENVGRKTDTFFVWEELNLKDAENTGFIYQDGNFIDMLLESIRLGIIRPFASDSLQLRLSEEVFLGRINNNAVSKKVILKSKVKYHFDEIIHQEIIAISIYSTKGNLICTFSYQNLKQNLFLDNSEAMICLGENLNIPLTEVFGNHYF